jgi:hypothetical protein
MRPPRGFILSRLFVEKTHFLRHRSNGLAGAGFSVFEDIGLQPMNGFMILGWESQATRS